MSKSRITLATAIGLLSSSVIANEVILEEIEVLGRRVNLVGSASSASEGRVSQRELELRPLLRTGEVMETIPGLVATQHSGSGKANQYFLRGFNLDHGTDFATAVDGMPVNMRSHGHGQGYTDLSFLIPETVEEIVYRKGSYYPSKGDFSGAGAADIGTLNRMNSGKASVGVGEDGFRRLLVMGSLGDSLLYAAEHENYDGPWTDTNEDVKKTNVWVKQQWADEDSRLALTFMGYDNAWNSADQIPKRAVSQGLISELGSIDPTLGGESSRYSVSLDWGTQLSASSLQARAYAIDYELDLWSNFTYFSQAGGDQFKQADKRHIIGGDLAWQLPGEWRGLPMRNTLGTDFRYDDVEAVGLYHSQARRVSGPIREDEIAQWSLGVYWENEVHWTDRFRSVFGLRHDYYDFDVEALQAADPSTLAANSGRDSDSLSTASLSLIYSFNDFHEVYASAGQGFHSNDARGVTASLDPVSGEALDAADPLVKTMGYEIGLRSFLGDKLNASIALWQLELNSELLFVGDEGVTEDTGVSSQRRGLELTAYYYLNDAWTFDLEYAYTDAQFDEAVGGSRAIPGALETVLSAGLTLQLADRLQSQIRLRHFDDFPLDDGARADGSTLVNWGMAYQFRNALELNLDVLNLFNSKDHDVEYYYESQLAGEAEPVADHHYHVFEPRTVRLHATYRF